MSKLEEFCDDYNIRTGSNMYDIVVEIMNKNSGPIDNKVWQRDDLYEAPEETREQYHTPVSEDCIKQMLVEACIAFNYLDGLKLMSTMFELDCRDVASYVCIYGNVEVCKFMCEMDLSSEDKKIFRENVSSDSIWYWREAILRYLIDSNNYIMPSDPNVLLSACMIVDDTRVPEETRNIARAVLGMRTGGEVWLNPIKSN